PPSPEDWGQPPRPQPAGDARGGVDRFALPVAPGVPEGRVPMGATEAPVEPDLLPTGSSCCGEEPDGDDELARLPGWPIAPSKTPLLLGWFDWGLAVLLGRDPRSWAMLCTLCDRSVPAADWP